MSAWLIGAGLIVVLAVAYFLYDPGNRGLDQSELAVILRNLVVRFDNGGLVKITVPKSKVWVSVRRTEGDSRTATIALKIPKGLLSEHDLSNFEERMEHAGHVWTRCTDDFSAEATVASRVFNIDNPTSYSSMASAIRDLLRVAGVSSGKKINVAEIGQPKWWMESDIG
jgi:hypothetical protein